MMYLRAESVFILDYFASKSVDAVHEAFSNAYPDKAVPNKTIIHQMITQFRAREEYMASAYGASKQLKSRPYRFKAVHQL
jgi:hypothetical protein